jgi:hypothetical protein
LRISIRERALILWTEAIVKLEKVYKAPLRILFISMVQNSFRLHFPILQPFRLVFETSSVYFR